MIFAFDFVILIFMVVAAIIALNVKDLLSASMIFGIYDLINPLAVFAFDFN